MYSFRGVWTGPQMVVQCLKINTYNRGVITMAYIINKTNGTQIAVVEDGTIYSNY